MRTWLGVYGLRNSQDKFMLRIKIPAGRLKAAALRCIAGIVRDFIPNGLLHVTTRQDIELHGVPRVNLIESLQRLYEFGLTCLGSGGPGVRNITCCPFSGISDQEVFDTGPYALALNQYFQENRDYEALPKKMKISFESCCSDHVGTRAQDIGIQAFAKTPTMRGFRIWVGGGMGALPMKAHLLEDCTDETMLLPTILGILRTYNEDGERKDTARARLKFLIQRLGIEEFRRRVLTGRVPTLLLLGPSAIGAEKEGSASQHEGIRGVHNQDSKFSRWKEANVRCQKQKGFNAALLRCPLGDLSATQATGIAELADTFGIGEIRTTISQNLLLPCIPSEKIEILHGELDDFGMAVCCAEEVMDVTRCVGGQTCLSSITASRNMALALESLFLNGLAAEPALRHVSIKVSGCPNSCGHHHLANIGLFGVAKKIGERYVPSYQILLGGRAGFEDARFGQPVATVPAARCVKAVERIARIFLEHRQPGEDFSPFVARMGREGIAQKLGDLTAIPSGELEPECFRDIGQETEFQVRAKRGECSV